MRIPLIKIVVIVKIMRKTLIKLFEYYIKISSVEKISVGQSCPTDDGEPI